MFCSFFCPTRSGFFLSGVVLVRPVGWFFCPVHPGFCLSPFAQSDFFSMPIMAISVSINTTFETHTFQTWIKKYHKSGEKSQKDPQSFLAPGGLGSFALCCSLWPGGLVLLPGHVCNVLPGGIFFLAGLSSLLRSLPGHLGFLPGLLLPSLSCFIFFFICQYPSKEHYT